MFYVYSIDETLKEMMKLEYIHEDGDVFVDYSWEIALSIDGDVYPEWCLEFFSTMYFEKDMDMSNLMKEKCIWFGLCGREHVLTLPRYFLGLFTPSNLEHRLFATHFSKLEVDDGEFNYVAYWKKIKRPTNTYPRKSLIREPLMRIVHKLIVGSLIHKMGSRERCQKRDLWMTNALEESRGINFAWVIAEHLSKHGVDFGSSSVPSSGYDVGGSSRGFDDDDDAMDGCVF
ncbi:hypothetical protein Tco_1288281 [Tanacetum coccineum]